MSVTQSGRSFVIGSVMVAEARKLNHEGHHATIYKGVLNGNEVIVKEHPVDIRKANKLIYDWRIYHKSIDSFSKTTGIFAIDNIAFELDSQKVVLRFVDLCATSPDISYLFASQAISQNEKIGLAASLLKALASIPYNQAYQTIYMIDGEFSNFCPRQDKGLDYIDLFPAHVRDSKTGLLQANAEHLAGQRSQALETFLTGDIYGIVGRFWGMLRRDQPELWRAAQTHPVMQAVLDRLPIELKDYSYYLFQTDTAFIQSVYKNGLQEPESTQLNTILADWKQRDKTLPPEIFNA